MSTAILRIEKKKSEAPQLRFPEFEENWKEKRFGELYSFYNTNSLSRDKLNYDEGEVYNIHYGDIHTKFQTHFYLKNENVPLIISDVDLSNIKKESYCKNGDIIMADASEDYADIGKSIELIDICNVKLLSGLHTFLARPISDKTFVGFTSYLLKSWKLRKQIMLIAQGTKVLSLSTNRVANLKLDIPTLAEQRKIASFLSTVDEKIQQLSSKKELLEQYKKGVMQQLFAGKLRFKDENGKDYPDWEEKKLGEVGKIVTGSTPTTSNVEYYNGKQLFVSPADINGTRYVLNTKTTLTDLGFEKGRKLKKGTVLFVCIGSTIGKVAIAGLDCITNQQINAIEANSFNSNNFIFSLLEFNAIRIKLLAGVQAVPQINKTDFSNLKFMFPSLLEQKKIADFLSSIDAKIENVNQQLIQTQSFKKGLLQKMFI
ncbi:restriction endonuclease subunit S [Flavobacterium sp. H4147]|uniref:restriction endonuclease subunit S n=1 Tax=Flavobacterium sp. H4147 TaxID=3034149 RepID=UPI0023EC7BDF|nr:restriction endonuclease subunit S [Flavobacterium sp. H4147]